MARSLACCLALWAVASATNSETDWEAGLEPAALQADDECEAQDPASCALSALQLRGAKLEPESPESPESPERVDAAPAGAQAQAQAQAQAPAVAAPVVGTPVAAEEFVPQVPAVKVTSYKPKVDALALPSKANTYTFYMYRSVSDNPSPALENVNTGNLAGVMWYLHNEVVSTVPRKFGITRIIRMKVQTKAPQVLLDRGMNFGVRYAYDMGNCTGPGNCTRQYETYGYFVGCNNLGEFPFPTPDVIAKGDAHAVHYPGAIWYALPGQCPTKEYKDKTSECKSTQPGGACRGSPTGTGECTYTYETAGEIRLSDLEAMPSNFTSGFWEDINSDEKCAKRLSMAQELFALKYPKLPKDTELPSPRCDFDFNAFYWVTPAPASMKKAAPLSVDAVLRAER